MTDVHNHPNWHGHDIDALLRNMDTYGIERTWLLSWEIPRREFDVCPGYYGSLDPRGTGAELFGIVEGLQRHPDRFVGGWAPDPRDRHARLRLQAAVEIHGIRVYGELKCRMRYDAVDALAMYRFCGRLGLPVLFHLECAPQVLERQTAGPGQWVEWYGGDMAVVRTMCTTCPETRFIGHGPGFWRAISADADSCAESYPSGPVVPDGDLVRVLRDCPNLWCDLSAGSGANALARDLDYGRLFVHEFQDRILFGRDFFDDRQLQVLEDLDMPDSVYRKVLWDNAQAILEPASAGAEQ